MRKAIKAIKTFGKTLSPFRFGIAGLSVATWAAWDLSPVAGRFTLAASLVILDLATR